MFDLKGTPLYVHVTAFRWDGYGPDTFRSIFLQKLLEMTGGISADVAPGWYDFNVERRGFKLYSLLPPHVE